MTSSRVTSQNCFLLISLQRLKNFNFNLKKINLINVTVNFAHYFVKIQISFKKYNVIFVENEYNKKILMS